MKKLLSLLWTSLALVVTIPVLADSNIPQVPDAVIDAISADKAGSTYIVRMSDEPVIAYTGNIRGLQRTAPAKGEKLNPNSPRVTAYVDYLQRRHNKALATVGAAGKKIYHYQYSFNGFAASLNARQASALELLDDVVSVERDILMQLDTYRTPGFLGLTDPGGLWDRLGGNEDAGEGVIVGIIDSGIWPENPSFSDRNEKGKLVFRQIPGWHGRCIPGEWFPASDCNRKLVSAQWYNGGWGGDDGVKAIFPYEYLSTRDADGHGSHTASTAAGNYGVPVNIDGVELGEVSGIAPRARIAAYKVCWGREGGGCYGSDSVAAIDQAVADGVDVLNFSISGTRNNYLDAVEAAFLYAADAGIFVAASAGNSGPNAGTVAHISPWLTTVAAGTKDEFYAGEVTLGDGSTYTGPSRASAVGPAALVYAGYVGLAGKSASARLCYADTLDPAAVAGKIVACDRGGTSVESKSLAVFRAGGIGMILMNTPPDASKDAIHRVPTIHVDPAASGAIFAYINNEGVNATASIEGNIATQMEAPFVAAFSSRGPNQAGADLLKPDIMAPGVNILAAVSPDGFNGRHWSLLSGTSMASPHVAGLGALLTHLHPDWSPAMMKSALMTTASQTTNSGNVIPGGPFAFGAGQVVPNSAADPGLVYDAGPSDYRGFLCGTGQLVSSQCSSVEIDPSNLNYPSISVGALPGRQVVVRTVTNTGSAGIYDVSVDAPAGVDVSVSPASLNLDAGESASYEVTFTVNNAVTFEDYTFGELTWSDGVHEVQSPLVVYPVPLAVPDHLVASGTSGSLNLDVQFGYAGSYTAGAHGLEPATTNAGEVADDPYDDINTALGTCDGTFPFTCAGITWHQVTVPPGALQTRISLFDAFTDGADDLDIYVFNNVLTYVDGSFSEGSNEEVNIVSPNSPVYYVAVHGYQTDGGADTGYILFDWSVPGDAGSGSLVIDSAPAVATLGTTGTVDISWSGLSADSKYLGAVSHRDAGGLAEVTLIKVDTD